MNPICSRLTAHVSSQFKFTALYPRRKSLSMMLQSCLLLGFLVGQATWSQAAGVMISGSLANFDVRYPNSLPNDFEIVIYGPGLTAADVLYTWDTNTLLVGNGVQWGQASSIVASINNDPTSQAFGLNCVTVRWAGPPRPAMVGQMVHFGVRLRIGAAVAHQEAWWTINGTRILRPCDPHVTWICSRNVWLICVANPNPNNIYVYGPRWFQVAPTTALPQLTQLNTNINPGAFGGTWVPLTLPGTGPVLCIPPWCRIYFPVPVVNWRPIIFQIAARNVPDTILPLPIGTNGPNPNDFDGTNGTMAILTTRATQELAEDITGEGSVGASDFNMLRARFGQSSPDITGN